MNETQIITVNVHDWDILNKFNAFELMNRNYSLTVRKIGKGVNAVYQKKITRSAPNPNGDLIQVIADFVEIAQDMTEPEIKTSYNAVGGGQGHYDYAVQTHVTGWVTLSKEEVNIMNQLIVEDKAHNKRIREAEKLEKQAYKLRHG